MLKYVDKGEIMKTLKTIIIAALIILGLVYFAHVVGAAEAVVNTDKFDGECTGQETGGRCADKCPEGSYSIGIGKNGEVLCKLEPTGCPYGDSIPLGPECDKHKPVEENPAPQQVETPAEDPLPYSDTVDSFQGK